MARALDRRWPWLIWLALSLLWAGPALAAEKVYQGKYVSVVYDDQDQLEAFAEKIAPGSVTRAVNQVLINDRDLQGQDLGAFLDRLLKRVQLILDMPLPQMKLRIKLFGSRKEVQEAYRGVTGGRAIAHQTREPLAFYWKKDNTVHVQTQILNIGMLAHEMGHAVLYHFFITPPPLKVQEMLCMYVDREITKDYR